MEDKIKELENRIKILETVRITQDRIIPDAVKSRHLGEPNRYLISGVIADRPTGRIVGQGAVYFFATDENKLYIHNGTAWKSVALT